MSGPFKMTGHTLPGPNQVSPAKHGDTPEPHTKEEAWKEYADKEIKKVSKKVSTRPVEQ